VCAMPVRNNPRHTPLVYTTHTHTRCCHFTVAWKATSLWLTCYRCCYTRSPNFIRKNTCALAVAGRAQTSTQSPRTRRLKTDADAALLNLCPALQPNDIQNLLGNTVLRTLPVLWVFVCVVCVCVCPGVSFLHCCLCVLFFCVSNRVCSPLWTTFGSRA